MGKTKVALLTLSNLRGASSVLDPFGGLIFFLCAALRRVFFVIFARYMCLLLCRPNNKEHETQYHHRLRRTICDYRPRGVRSIQPSGHRGFGNGSTPSHLHPLIHTPTRTTHGIRAPRALAQHRDYGARRCPLAQATPKLLILFLIGLVFSAKRLNFSKCSLSSASP